MGDLDQFLLYHIMDIMPLDHYSDELGFASYVTTGLFIPLHGSFVAIKIQVICVFVF